MGSYIPSVVNGTTPIHLGSHCGTWHVPRERCQNWPLIKLRNGFADCDQIWCIIKDQAAMHNTQVMAGVHLHVRTCTRADVPLFRISEMAGRIALKFGLWLGTHYLNLLQELMLGTCARAYPFSVSFLSSLSLLKFC